MWQILWSSIASSLFDDKFWPDVSGTTINVGLSAHVRPCVSGCHFKDQCFAAILIYEGCFGRVARYLEKPYVNTVTTLGYISRINFVKKIAESCASTCHEWVCLYLCKLFRFVHTFKFYQKIHLICICIKLQTHMLSIF